MPSPEESRREEPIETILSAGVNKIYDFKTI